MPGTPGAAKRTNVQRPGQGGMHSQAPRPTRWGQAVGTSCRPCPSYASWDPILRRSKDWASCPFWAAAGRMWRGPGPRSFPQFISLIGAGCLLDKAAGSILAPQCGTVPVSSRQQHCEPPGTGEKAPIGAPCPSGARCWSNGKGFSSCGYLMVAEFTPLPPLSWQVGLSRPHRVTGAIDRSLVRLHFSLPPARMLRLL